VQNQLHIGAYIAKKQAVYSLVCFALIFPLEPNLGILSAGFVVFVVAMPTGTFGDVTAYAIRAIFLKRKASALFNRAGAFSGFPIKCGINFMRRIWSSCEIKVD